jgi:hypothetical protein
MRYSEGVLFGVEAGLLEGVEAGVETGARVGVGAGTVIGVVMLMFSFFVPLPKIRSRNTNNKMASTMTRKITSTATTPVLPPPPFSAIT